VTPRLNPHYRMTGMGLVRVGHLRRRMSGMGVAARVPITSPAPGIVHSIGPVISPWQFNPIVNPIAQRGQPVITSTPGSSVGVSSPVPPGYPTNQFYVAPDGTLWEYAAAQSQWIPIPSNYAAAAAAAAGATPATPQVTAALAPTAAPAQTVNVASSSGYSDILTWLQNSTLINGVPNWVIALGGAAVLFKIARPSGGKTR